MKKYGLLKYTTRNYGDDIQSLAAAQFMPGIDYYMDRDHLDAFTAKENVYVIFNGWFRQGLANWPPSPNIRPLLISFHIPYDNKGYEIIANPKLRNYYKKFEPIGCRDYWTLEVFKKVGIKAYFSGCLTLTFQNKCSKQRNGIYFVDLFGTGSRLSKNPIFRNVFWRQFPKDIKKEAIFLTHWCRKHRQDFQSRFKRAKELIDIYSNAKLVITGRLHCALPCLALGTPVVFIYNEASQHRFGGLMNMMRSYTLTDIKDKKFDINWDNPDSNPVDISNIASKLRTTCNEFVRL